MGPRGGGDAEADALLAHVESSPQPFVQRVAARGVVAVICSGRCAQPERALRRCLVGTPPSCVDEVCGACARMVKVGVFDADAMCGELLAALAASHASATTDRRRLGDECRVARALVRGIAGVVAVSIVDPARRSGTDSDSIRGKPPARGRLAEWVGPKHPLARALRAHPTGAPPAILAAIARISSHGPDSATALAGVPTSAALRALRPFLRHALLSEVDSTGMMGGGFRSSLHAHLVRIACGEGVDAETSTQLATLLAGCLPWYRTSTDARTRAWVSHTCAADVADVLERAWSLLACRRSGGPGGTKADTAGEAMRMSVRDATLDAASATAREARLSAIKGERAGASIGALRRMLAVLAATTAARDVHETTTTAAAAVLGGDATRQSRRTRRRLRRWCRSTACDLAATCAALVAGDADEAAAAAATLGEFASSDVFASSDGLFGAPVAAGTCARAVAGATVSGAMALARDRGGALAALLATPSVGFNAGRRSRVDGSDGSDDRDGDVWGSISYYPSMDSALVDALTPDWRAGDANADARTLATLAADTADDLAAAIADAKRRRRRKYRDDLSDDELSDEFARDVSHAPPLLPLALASHPSARVREAAAASLGERMAAVPSRAPATLPPLLLAVKSASNFAKTETKGSAAVDADDDARAKARAVLASLRAATAGAAHPLGAPVALRALSPLVTPFEMDAGHEAPTSSKGGSKGGDDALKLGFSAAAKTPDPKAHALALVLLADLWCHHKGAFPRLRAALDHASSSREPAVLVGAAAALLTCARKDPRGACDLVGPLRSFLDPRKAPPVARALALETVRTMCDADVLDFYAAFRVVVDSAKKDESGGPPPKDGGVRREWARLLGAGWLDAAARPAAAAAVAGAAWECAVWAPGGSNDDGTREAAYEALARFDPEVLVCAPPATTDGDGDASPPGESPPGESPPVPADELANAYLTDPAPTTSGAVRAASAVVERVARLERNRAARSTLAPGGWGGLHGSGRGDRAQGKGDEKDRRAQRDAGRVAASADPLLHRLLNTAPRRLRTMPRLDGAAKGTAGDVGNRCGPAGPRAHLLLFRPPPRRSDDLNDLNDDDAAGDERRRKPGRRAMEVNAELRDVAEAHRRAFVTAAHALREPPRAHWWHAATAVKSWSRYVRRWLRAESAALANVAESAAIAAEEAVASVARVCTETLTNDASTPDARSNAAMALSSLAVLHADFFEGGHSFSNPGGDDAGDGFEPTGGIAESATDAILDALTRGAMDGAERGAFMAYAAASSRCHAADRSRRRRCAEYLSGACSGGRQKGPNWSGRVAGAAAEALGLFLRGVGRDVETHGPGAGAWRTETLARYRDVLTNAAGDALGSSEASSDQRYRSQVDDNNDDFEGEAVFRVGLTHGEAFAAAGADCAGGGFGHVVGHLRRLEDVLARWIESSAGGDKSPGAGCSAAEVAGAVAALPTAAAFALASNAPVDRHVVNALRLTAELASSTSTPSRKETKNVQSKMAESIRTNALASCGSLLGVALAAGCSVERPLANAVVDALTAVLLGGTSGSSSTTTTPSLRLFSETAQAAASLGLAACVGGDWILPSVDRVVANRGLSGADGGREKDAGASTLSAPLVWGGEEGAALAKRAIRALEAVASAEGTVTAAGTIAGTRAREAAAWGLAAAAGACAARVNAWGASTIGGHAEHTKTRKVPTGGGEAAPAAAPASASTRNTGTNGGALGALAAAALSPDVTDDAATRALVVLCSLDRLPAGDWPGALRRLTRRGGDQNPALVDACVALAVAHPGPAVGGGLLESLLGSDEEGFSFAHKHEHEGAGFDEFGVREVAFDGNNGGRTRRLASPPPPRVLAALGECVAALPRAAAAVALRRCINSVAVVVERVGARARTPVTHRKSGGDGVDSPTVDDDNSTDSTEVDTIRAAWAGLASAASRLPRGPWTEDDVVAACVALCAAIRRPGGPELDLAVDALTVVSKHARSAARAAIRAADEAAHPFAAKSLRTRLAVAGSIPRGDVPPLATFFLTGSRADGGGASDDAGALLVATHLVATGKALARPPRWLRVRWLEEASSLPDGLRTLAVLCRAWCGDAVAAAGWGGRIARLDAVVRWLPATLPAAIGDGDEKQRAAAARIATTLAELATGERTNGCCDAETRNAAVQTVMAVREMLPGDVWERHAWRLESPATADA